MEKGLAEAKDIGESISLLENETAKAEAAAKGAKSAGQTSKRQMA